MKNPKRRKTTHGFFVTCADYHAARLIAQDGL